MNKKISKYLAVFFSLAMSGVLIASCGGETKNESASEKSESSLTPTHSYSEEWSFDASKHWHACTIEGCNEKKDISDHAFVNHPAVAATCSSEGNIEYKSCSVCDVKVNANGEIVTDVSVATVSSNHKFGAWHDEVKATCSAAGTKGYKDCEYCLKHFDKDGKEITDLTIAIDPEAHNYGDWTTKTEAGYHQDKIEHRVCTLCGKEGETREVAGTQTHQYGSEWKTDKTSHWHECECGEKSDVAAHTNDADSVYRPLHEDTCMKYCGICDQWVANYLHDYGTPVVTKEASYSEAGEQTETCSRCNYVKTTIIPKLSAKDRVIKMDQTYFSKEWDGGKLTEATYYAKCHVKKANNSDSAVTSVASGLVQFYYRVAGTTDEFSRVNIPTAVGTYEVKIKLTATDEWNAVESEILTLEITKAKITLESSYKLALTDDTIGLPVASFTYNGYDGTTEVNRTVKVWAPSQYNRSVTIYPNYIGGFFLTDGNGATDTDYLSNFEIETSGAVSLYVSDYATFVKSGAVQSYSINDDYSEITLTFSVQSGILSVGDKVKREGSNSAPFLLVTSIVLNNNKKDAWIKGSTILTVTFTRCDSFGSSFEPYNTEDGWVGCVLIPAIAD